MAWSSVLLKYISWVVHWQQSFLQYLFVSSGIHPIRTSYEDSGAIFFDSSPNHQTATSKFHSFRLYFGVYLNSYGLRTYSLLLENSSILHSSLNVMSFQKHGSNMAYALHQFKRLLTCRSFNKSFFTDICPINPYFHRIRFTVLTQEVWLDFHSMYKSRAVFFGFPFEAQMSNCSDLYVLSGLQLLLGKFSKV